MVNRVFKRAAIGGVCSALLVSLSACSVFESKKVDYKSAKRTQPLDIPPELTAPGKDERYTVSELGSKGTTFSLYQAERSATKTEKGEVTPLLPTYDKSRIEKAGMQRWLVVAAPPDKVWPLVKQFLAERNLNLKLESPETGIFETEWSEKKFDVPQGMIRGAIARALGNFYSSSERDRFRIRLEPGIDKDSTEVFISHRGVEEVYITEGQDQTRWQPRASDPDLEAEMLRRLTAFIGMDEAKASSLLAGSPDSSRARLTQDANGLQLLVEERFDRAWRRVGLVLDRNGFTVEDRDRAKGIYYVRYVDPLADKKKDEKGFLSSLAFWRSDKDGPAADHQFRVNLAAISEATTRVTVSGKDGGDTAAKDTAQRILDLLLKELR